MENRFFNLIKKTHQITLEAIIGYAQKPTGRWSEPSVLIH